MEQSSKIIREGEGEETRELIRSERRLVSLIVVFLFIAFSQSGKEVRL
jgi:hypothetical protein